jgi:hypothetical protein
MTRSSWRQQLCSLALVLAGCAWLAGLPAPAGEKAGKEDKAGKEKGDKVGKVTKANYDKLKKNMTEKEVVALLGEPTATGTADVPQFGKVKEATWKGGKDEILVLFKAEKLVHKQSTFGALKPKGKDEAKGSKVTQENYDKIAVGGKQTLAEVEKILGGKGKEITEKEVNERGLKLPEGATAFMWGDDERNIVVIVSDGKVQFKSAYQLAK